MEQIRPRQDYIASETAIFLPPKTVRCAKDASTRHGVPLDGRSRLLRSAKQEIVFGRGAATSGSHGGKSSWHGVLRGDISLEKWQQQGQQQRQLRQGLVAAQRRQTS